MDSPSVRLGQPVTTKTIAGLFFLASLITAASSLSIPWITMRVVLCLYSACFVFFAFRRFQLTFCSVDLSATELRVDYPWKGGKSKISCQAIKHAHFSRFPFDLVITTDQGDVRIPRTLNGFQKICDQVFSSLRGGQDSIWPVTVKVQKALVLCGILCTLITTGISFQMLKGGLTWVGVPLIGLSIACTAVFLDELILRRYYFHPEGLRVKGFFTNKWYPKETLRVADVTNGTFWSRVRLEFDGNAVEIEDRRVDTPITMIASLVEQEWKCKVQGAKSKYNFPKFFYANPDPAAKS